MRKVWVYYFHYSVVVRRIEEKGALPKLHLERCCGKRSWPRFLSNLRDPVPERRRVASEPIISRNIFRKSGNDSLHGECRVRDVV